ncbi:MAG TPA: prepilin-type N-terminal cleavage/methylation domain-containing protein [Elusimicrobiota bacterium]|nr:prepilin-type N-terminal cleavage/methylation domain-containing protein [Elusimicrobiota bacterium]
MTKTRPARRGFTLIELMIVVAIIGILAAIAIPKFADLLRKSKEGATKGNIGAIRSALSIYYGDMEGQFPSDPVSLTVNGKYLAVIPTAKAPDYHNDSSVIGLASILLNFTDAGGWGYMDIPSNPSYGNIYINCTHTDTKGSLWTNY